MALPFELSGGQLYPLFWTTPRRIYPVGYLGPGLCPLDLSSWVTCLGQGKFCKLQSHPCSLVLASLGLLVNYPRLTVWFLILIAPWIHILLGDEIRHLIPWSKGGHWRIPPLNLINICEHLLFSTWFWRVHHFLGIGSSFNVTISCIWVRTFISYTWINCFLDINLFCSGDPAWWPKMSNRLFLYWLPGAYRHHSMHVLRISHPLKSSHRLSERSVGCWSLTEALGVSILVQPGQLC